MTGIGSLSSQIARLKCELRKARLELYASRANNVVLRRAFLEHVEPLVGSILESEVVRLEGLRLRNVLGLHAKQRSSLVRLAVLTMRERVKHLTGLELPDDGAVARNLTLPEAPI